MDLIDTKMGTTYILVAPRHVHTYMFIHMYKKSLPQSYLEPHREMSWQTSSRAPAQGGPADSRTCRIDTSEGQLGSVEWRDTRGASIYIYIYIYVFFHLVMYVHLYMFLTSLMYHQIAQSSSMFSLNMELLNMKLLWAIWCPRDRRLQAA